MAERPILFSAPMVRAILAGMKTQTRRAMRDQVVAPGIVKMARPGYCEIINEYGVHIPGFYCPYGQPGDRLWVKETFQRFTDDGEIMYAADSASFEAMNQLKRDQYAEARWRPSIFMPRWASRILLEITEVRVERLQDISEADASDEGVASDPACPAYDAYAALWDQINGTGAWDANPWVWAITFKRIQEAAHG